MAYSNQYNRCKAPVQQLTPMQQQIIDSARGPSPIIAQYKRHQEAITANRLQEEHKKRNYAYKLNIAGNRPMYDKTSDCEKMFVLPKLLPSLFECSLIALKNRFSYTICNYILNSPDFPRAVKNETIEKWHCQIGTKENNYERGWVHLAPCCQGRQNYNVGK